MDVLLNDSLEVLVCNGQSDHALFVSVASHQVVHRTLVHLYTLLSSKHTRLVRIKKEPAIHKFPLENLVNGIAKIERAG